MSGLAANFQLMNCLSFNIILASDCVQTVWWWKPTAAGLVLHFMQMASSSVQPLRVSMLRSLWRPPVSHALIMPRPGQEGSFFLSRIWWVVSWVFVARARVDKIKQRRITFVGSPWLAQHRAKSLFGSYPATWPSSPEVFNLELSSLEHSDALFARDSSGRPSHWLKSTK